MHTASAPRPTRPHQRIAYRLLVVLLPVILLIQISAGAWMVWNTRKLLHEQHELQLAAIARRQTEALALDVWSFNPESIYSILSWDIADQSVARMRVLTLGAGGVELGPDQEHTQTLDQGPACVALRCRSYPIHLRVGTQMQQIGTLQIETSTEHIRREIQSLLLARLLELLAVTALLVLVLFSAIRQIVLLPLSRLAQALRKVSAANGSQVIEFQHERQDEFSQVAAGFNAVVAKVEADLVELRQAEQAAQMARAQAEGALQQLRTTQDALVESERLASLGELVAGVAHEVNTPVGNILMAATTLHDHARRFRQSVESGQVMRSELLQSVDTFSEASELIERSAERAATLISNFKMIAVDQVSEFSRQFDLSAYLHSIVSSLSPTLKHTPVRVRIDCPEGIRMTSYPGALAQCITNLVMNAVTHAFEPNQTGTVCLTARATAEGVQLEVQDDGKGIPELHQGRVFEPFFTTRLGQGGSGLGLTIVRNIVVSQLGGQIGLKSLLGQGTTFTLNLPLVAPDKGGRVAASPRGAR